MSALVMLMVALHDHERALTNKTEVKQHNFLSPLGSNLQNDAFFFSSRYSTDFILLLHLSVIVRAQ